MKCVNPRRLPNKASVNPPFDSYILTSCGKCYACLSNRRRSWLFRLQHEHLNSLLTLFCSFTYDDECRPHDHLVHKEHLQKFFKKLREYEDFRYYAIGEYGTHTKREHYHAVIFFKSLQTNSVLDDYVGLIQYIWPFGFVSVSRATYRRLNYVLHYHTRPKDVDGRKTFQLFSKGLGSDFVNVDLVKYLLESGKSTIHDFNGRVYVIPRYYRKKLKDMFISTAAGVTQLPSNEFVMDFHQDDEECLKVFGKHLWQISSVQYAQFLHDKVDSDKRKLNKYNFQDKMI